MNNFFLLLILNLLCLSCISKPSEKPSDKKPDLNLWKSFLNENKLTSNQICFCAKDNNKVQNTCSETKLWPIASLSKIFLSYWALEELGSDYQFKTSFFLDKKKKALHIKGSQDPYFLEEGIFYLISELNKINIKGLNSISFDDSFYYHFTNNKEDIKKKLTQYFNTSKWNKLIKNQFQEMRKEYSGLIPLTKKPIFSVQSIHQSNSILPQGVEFIYSSSPLSVYLRILNAYSNNFSSDSLLKRLGGIHAFNDFFKNKFKWKENSFSFYTGSGLPRIKKGIRKDNLASCNQVLEVIESFEKKLNTKKINLANILVTPGVDVGTLKKRFKKHPKYRYSFWGKTGTLNNNSALAGIIYTNKKPLIFAMMGKNKNPNLLKEKEEIWLNKWTKPIGFKQVNYQPKLFYPFKDKFIIKK